MQWQAKVKEASLSFLNSYSGNVKPPTLISLSVGDFFTVGEPFTEVLWLLVL